MASLGNIGRALPGFLPRWNIPAFATGGNPVVEIDPAPVGIILLTYSGVRADVRRTSDDGVCRFYDLSPGEYLATLVHDGAPQSWTVSVLPSSYTVTPVSSGGGEPSYVSIG